MVKIYGASDDLVEIDNSSYREQEIDCFEKNVRIRFEDGTEILIGYHKPGIGVWWIKVLEQGPAEQKLTICEDEDADIYSDIFEIDSEIKKHYVVAKEQENG